MMVVVRTIAVVEKSKPVTACRRAYVHWQSLFVQPGADEFDVDSLSRVFAHVCFACLVEHHVSVHADVRFMSRRQTEVGANLFVKLGDQLRLLAATRK